MESLAFPFANCKPYYSILCEIIMKPPHLGEAMVPKDFTV